MLIIDVLVALGCISTALASTGLILFLRRKRQEGDRRQQLRRKGMENTAEAEIQSELICSICDQPVDPIKDLFVGGVGDGLWWHRACYRKAIQ